MSSYYEDLVSIGELYFELSCLYKMITDKQTHSTEQHTCRKFRQVIMAHLDGWIQLAASSSMNACIYRRTSHFALKRKKPLSLVAFFY